MLPGIFALPAKQSKNLASSSASNDGLCRAAEMKLIGSSFPACTLAIPSRIGDDVVHPGLPHVAEVAEQGQRPPSLFSARSRVHEAFLSPPLDSSTSQVSGVASSPLTSFRHSSAWAVVLRLRPGDAEGVAELDAFDPPLYLASWYSVEPAERLADVLLGLLGQRLVPCSPSSTGPGTRRCRPPG